MTNGKSEATRERILFAAAQVLSRRGYSATKLTEIAALAELRAPAIYYYFDSRQDLVAEVMAVGQYRLREYVTAAVEQLPSETDPLSQICAAAAAHLEIALELSDFATAVTRNTGQLPDAIRSRLREETRAYSQLWRELIERSYEAGQIRPDLNRHAAIKLVMGALNWTPEWWHRSDDDLGELVHTAQSLIRHGLGFPPAMT